MKFENKIATGYAASLVLLLGMGWSTYRTNMALIESNREEVRAQTFFKELETTRSLVESAESGMRGYVISGKEKFLEQYYRSTSRVLEQLEYLTSLDPHQGPRERELRMLNQMVEEKLKFTATVVQMVRRGALKKAEDTITTAYGKELMDDIRDLIIGIQVGEKDIFEQSERESIVRSRNAIISRLAMIALSVSLLTAGFLLILADAAKRRLAEARLVRAGEDLRRLAQKQESIRETERSRLSRELHDELGQNLTMMQIQLRLLEDRAGKRPQGRRELRQLAQSVEQAMATVKRLSLDLRPPMLDDLGIAAAAEWLVKDFCRKAGLRHRIAVEPESFTAPPEMEEAFFRILQEALTNVVRHASAGQVWMSLSAGRDGYRMTVRDDGKGFDPERIDTRRSLGMLGMRERAGACGGRVEITSRPGKGTSVEVTFPKAKEGRK